MGKSTVNGDFPKRCQITTGNFPPDEKTIPCGKLIQDNLWLDGHGKTMGKQWGNDGKLEAYCLVNIQQIIENYQL